MASSETEFLDQLDRREYLRRLAARFELATTIDEVDHAVDHSERRACNEEKAFCT